jgi:hypothetical protein
MYSAVVLDEKSQLKLATWADKNVKVNGVRLPVLIEQNGWKVYCHHMTIQFPGTPEFVKQYVDTKQTLEVTHIGVSDKVVAVRVVGFPSSNKIPHITVAVNSRSGGKPMMSNKITDWTAIEGGPKLTGEVKELD